MTATIRDKKRLDDNGEWIIEHEYLLDGQVVSAEEFGAALPDQEGTPMFGNSTVGWPIRSEAMAVHRKQIPEVLARNKKHGLSIPYDRTGRPILADAGQRKALMKVERYIDRNSFYGA